MAGVPKVNLPNMPSESEITSFLSKVDEIETVIKGLNSEDDQKRELYMSKADEMIAKISEKKKLEYEDNDEEDKTLPKTKTGFNKTSINKDAYKNDKQMSPPSGPVLTENMDQKAFMAAMEADAKERSERKKEREKIANKLKDQGNTEFKQGNYKEALRFYDEAISEVRDSSVLYTNRAQARIKLGMFTEALKDCDLALRLWPNCLKAYVHQGHAYLALKDYDKARESYKQILTFDKQKETMVNEYLANVNRTEEASSHEAKAAKLFEEGNDTAKNIVDLLASVNKKDQLPLYYSGGFRVISHLLVDIDAQTLFRTHNGLQLPVEHPLLYRTLCSSLQSLSMADRDLITAALEMLTAACKNNETNQQLLLNLPQFPDQITAILEVKFKGHGRLLKASCLNLLHEISLTGIGRAAIVGKFTANRLVPALLPLMMKTSSYENIAAALLNNIALEKKLKALLRDNIENTILPAFENFLNNNSTTPSVASLAASTATNLAGDTTIRKKMASRPSLWQAVGNLLAAYTSSQFVTSVEYLLGLLLNLSTNVDSSSLTYLNTDLTATCLTIITSTLSPASVMRSLAVLGNILPHCEQAVNFLCQENRTLVLLDCMKKPDREYFSPALKCITALTQKNEKARELISENKGTSLLLTLLSGEDEVVIGNAALCLSHLCQVPKVCSKLTKTNIIQKLLVLARDGRRPGVQANCAILVGKLVAGDSRHLERLRELHGIEILHGCMKHVK
ncbi:tetratricopeptide repeat protein 12-like [Physella acuta]|uniref:tetratricopeptide repeat protein 12-like n=1 Tax=Physella acuta TaxID=109671 RepID=UPI0027DCBC7E|nr:tetratricopeptide repeat protein 12-like [Physella acuta]